MKRFCEIIVTLHKDQSTHKMISNRVVSGGPALQISPHLSFGQYVVEKLRQFYDNEDIALINGDTNKHITFAELLQKIVNIATGLKTFGLKKGDVVALCSENCSEYIAVTVAASCIGATVTAFNIKYTQDEMSHAMIISKPRFIFCSEAALKNLLITFQETPCIEYIIQMNGIAVSGDVLMLDSLQMKEDVHTFKSEEVDPVNDTAFIFYSSGTTGLPKGVALTHRGSVHGSANFNCANKNKSRMLTVTRWYHVYGLLTSIQYVCSGNLVVYLSQLKPEIYLHAIQKFKITEILAVPTIVVMLAKSPLAQEYDLSSVNLIWCAAAPLGADTIRQALKILPGCKGIFQSYGLTETSLTVVMEPIGESSKPGSCGLPMPGIEAKVVDIKTREKLGPNQEGEVCLRGPTVMKGYVGNEGATREMFDEEGYIISGDIGYYDADGWFYIVDRIKEMIKYKGQQVAPAAVETVILSHNGVAECGVVGTPDELAGELPTAFVVPKPGSGLTEKDLLDFTADKLSPASRLRGGVIFIPKIPRNGSGKILRRILRKMLKEKDI